MKIKELNDVIVEQMKDYKERIRSVTKGYAGTFCLELSHWTYSDNACDEAFSIKLWNGEYHVYFDSFKELDDWIKRKALLFRRFTP